VLRELAPNVWIVTDDKLNADLLRELERGLGELGAELDEGSADG
jgi:hypothetical protein